jgi:hypothetical protein
MRSIGGECKIEVFINITNKQVRKSTVDSGLGIILKN